MKLSKYDIFLIGICIFGVVLAYKNMYSISYDRPFSDETTERICNTIYDDQMLVLNCTKHHSQTVLTHNLILKMQGTNNGQ